MAFEYAGNMNGGAPLIKRFQVSGDCYVGQMLECDAGGSGTGGHCFAMSAATADPDTANNILGICTAVVTSPDYNSTYQGDKATYDTTQAALVANDPVGPTLVDVIVLRPGDLVKGPVAYTTVGTAPTVQTVTTGSSDGLTFVSNALGQATIDDLSTSYCRTGANRGQYRVVTTGNTTTQTFTIPFTYDIAVGDTFVSVNMVEGYCKIEFDSQKQAFLGNDDQTHAFICYCHELNLEEAGKEYAVVSIHANHLWY